MGDRLANLQQTSSVFTSVFFSPRAAKWLFVFLLASGFALRLVDLTDLPLDFHPTRQLRAALMARGMYYQNLPDAPGWQRIIAVSQWKSELVFEPPVMEALAAFTYQAVGQEILWLGRLFAVIFWVTGAVGVFGLTSRLTSWDGAIGAAGLFLFLPYAISASRSFQPDSLMILCMAISLWALFRWQQRPSWSLALVAGLFSGLAMLFKIVAAFILLGGVAGMLLAGHGFRRSIRDWQVWLIGVSAILPPLIYQLYGIFIGGFLQGQFSYRFFPGLLLQPGFYIAWLNKINASLGGVVLGVALLGACLYLLRPNLQRGLVCGLWLGYAVYGLALPYHIESHDYYQLPLVLIAAISLAPLSEVIFQKFAEISQARQLIKLSICVALFIGLGAHAWQQVVALKAVDYRGEAVFWSTLGERLRPYKTVALVPDYGYRLAYWGWYNAVYWPTLGDFRLSDLAAPDPKEFEQLFADYATGKDFFLVTRRDELERQPELENYLAEHYPLVDREADYLLYDLRASMP